MKAESNVNDSCRNRAGREFFIFIDYPSVYRLFTNRRNIFLHSQTFHQVQVRCKGNAFNESCLSIRASENMFELSCFVTVVFVCLHLFTTRL